MSSLARRLLIVAAVEGLLLTPIPANNTAGTTPPKSLKSTPLPSRAASPSSIQAAGTVQIDYKTASIKKLLTANDEQRKREREGGLEVHGVAGLLTISPTSTYLIAITSRQQVALLNQVPIYVITDVALIPLFSQSAAQDALLKAKTSRARRASHSGAEFELSDEDDSSSGAEDEPRQAPPPPIAAGGVGSTRSSTDEEAGDRPPDTIGSRGVYGLFAQKWFSKTGWTAAAAKPQGHSVEGPQSSADVMDRDTEPGNQDVTPIPAPIPATPPAPAQHILDGTAPPPSPSPKPENQPASTSPESVPAPPLNAEQQAEQAKVAAQVKEDAVHSLTPKLLHTTRLLLGGSRSFFFSYEVDITRPLGQGRVESTETEGDVGEKGGEKEGDVDAPQPLWRDVDPLYFWNKHLLRPFISSNQHSLILPLMQGFIGQKTFYAPVSNTTTTTTPDAPAAAAAASPKQQQQPFILTLISRRSTKRAGLRYLRRGVDSEGNVANCVETEQLLSIPAPTQSPAPETPPDQLPWLKTYSFLQLRGSIPVFFQQSPYALRPKPVLLHSEASNKSAFERHFAALERRYAGQVFGVNLVERGSAENIVGERYERFVSELNQTREERDPGGRKVGWCWFDFHRVCRGMKFEKVALLLEEIGETLDTYGWTEVQHRPQGGEPTRGQTGIIRTNCMDCLDRTNVVQSACGRRALEAQLAATGLGVDLRGDPTDWFNLVWADNGDAISKQYASTAALKGDFTRTRKRNYRGALADFRLTVNRYFTGIVSDFFTQAAVDFLLGSVSGRVWDEFEAEMMSRDPAAEMGAWSSGGGGGAGDSFGGGIRANAIEISSKIVIADSSPDADSGDKETLLHGTTLLTPHTDNTLRSFPFSECVLLLTTHALYKVRFDFALEKVSSFERVDLRSIRGVQVGAYITSTLAPASMSEAENVGFVVRFGGGGGEEG